jgi:hypothetical protein
MLFGSVSSVKNGEGVNEGTFTRSHPPVCVLRHKVLS